MRVKETESELHALILEAREIKRLLPRYNSAGRDDRASWFIRLDLSEPYPVPERVSENASRGGPHPPRSLQERRGSRHLHRGPG